MSLHVTQSGFLYLSFSQLSRIDVRLDFLLAEQPFFIILIYIIAITLQAFFLEDIFWVIKKTGFLKDYLLNFSLFEEGHSSCKRALARKDCRETVNQTQCKCTKGDSKSGPASFGFRRDGLASWERKRNCSSVCIWFLFIFALDYSNLTA